MCGWRCRPITALRRCRNSRKLFVCPPPISTRKRLREQINSLLSKKYAKKADYVLDLDYPLAWLDEDAFAGTSIGTAGQENPSLKPTWAKP